MKCFCFHSFIQQVCGDGDSESGILDSKCPEMNKQLKIPGPLDFILNPNKFKKLKIKKILINYLNVTNEKI